MPKILQADKKLAISFFKSVVFKWLLSYGMFMFVYEFNNYWLLKRHNFDPSGHLLCAVVSYSNWLALIQAIQPLKQVFYILLTY